MQSEDLTGTTVAGYQLLERVGEGGTATVYRAQHPSRGVCAVKILRSKLRGDRTAVQRFLREAEFGARVSHTAVVQTYDFGEAPGGLHYLALEWADGELLAKFVRRSGPVALGLAATIVRHVADGLAAAHAAGIIHRDLKPENIIYDPRTQRARLLDFGIARDADMTPAERLTRTGFFVGTLQYVAPEALSGELVGEAADIYSLATITYFLLTAQLPYVAKSPRELFHQLLTQPPIPLAQARRDLAFPRAVEDAVMKGLSREPTKRQPSVAAFADEFAAAATQPLDVPRAGLLGSIKGLFGSRA
ncbi:MAG TPA: serine/threonine-protein kinase [Gemmatimonadales bacterium]|nr:serine/threonine-protein kinase [Gemmatimonadales bacterium]